MVVHDTHTDTRVVSTWADEASGVEAICYVWQSRGSFERWVNVGANPLV